jgi:PAS domain S-box-containing protein
VGFLAEQGKDITKALDKLCKELEKALGALGKGEKFDRLKAKLPQIFEDRTDELRVRMMVETYRDNPEDVKALKKIAKKLFKDEGIRKRLAPSLVEDLGEAGCSKEAIENLLAEIGEQERTKKSRVSIDAEELEELRRKAAIAEAGIDRGFEKEMQKLKIENKIIKTEKQRVESVIHNLAEGLVVVDKEGRVVLMNPAAERMLGSSQAERLGRPVAEGVGDEHMVTMTKGALRDSGENVANHVEVASPNEETKRILQASTAVIENEDGQTVGMVSVLSDVTRQKELDEMKTKFVANVSHELRTPLVAIQKSLALILNREVGDINEEQKKFLSLAERNIARLSRLINDLLDTSKLEAGNVALKPAKFPLTGLLMHVAYSVETWARDKRIEMKTEVAQDDPLEIEADSDRITQVLTNLVGNAIKFTPDGGRVVLSARRAGKDPELGPGEFIEVAVHDSGVGIEPADQKRIFDKFVQVNVTQQTGVASTGLGLTIAREIVQLHCGKIWVESKPKVEGSRFMFRLPVEFRRDEKLPPNAA